MGAANRPERAGGQRTARGWPEPSEEPLPIATVAALGRGQGPSLRSSPVGTRPPEHKHDEVDPTTYEDHATVMLTSRGQRFACVSFNDVAGAGTHLMVGKNVEGYQNHSAFMDAFQESSLLATPLGPPEKSPRWSHKKLTDSTAGPILKQIATLEEAHLTEAMIIQEFQGHRIPPLQAHLHPCGISPMPGIRCACT
ncbi:hypothetical protein D1007_20674 [Hordeum vulgare]|nr:hypothetical protein D1007_20674 [Hordeum vulgare]